MNTELKNKKSLAKRIKILFKVQKGTMGKYKSMANFEEPIVQLIRRTGRVEFHDKATSGQFNFTHSDGKERAIQLSPEFLKTFDYGKRTFKGYILDEDRPVPLPESPICTIDSYEMGITKTLNDMSKWKQKEYEGIGKMWWNIIIGLAILAGVLIIGKMLLPDLNLNPLAGKEVVEVVVNNASQLRP